MTRTNRERLVPLALLLASGLLASCGDADRVEVITGEAMGTTYRIRIVDPPDRGALADEVSEILGRIDADISTWRGDSWVSRFNAETHVDPVPVPDSLWPLLSRSLELWRATEGRFDIAVGALVECWGFGPASRSSEPDTEEVERARESAGSHLLALNRESRTLRKLRSGVKLDFSGIAKGWAVDRISERLASRGCGDFLVEFGGEIRARGRAPGRDGWRVAAPDSGEVFLLVDEAVATSGSTHQSREGRSHIIDPRSGRPVPVGPPVTVRTPTCAEADARATAGAVATAVEVRASRRDGAVDTE